MGVTANGVTACALVLGGGAGALLAGGHFGAAAILIVFASLGDALDGLLARATGTASSGGALFDAAVDRYEEFFILGGLAFYFRTEASGAILGAALFALLGSFMVSYGSAKAEALGVPVPPGIMRRTERAVIVCAGVALVPPAGLCVRLFGLASWLERAPIVLALVVLALGANLSAVARLRQIAREADRARSLS
jgi:CDP-diacylglycerol--glycerol-3-phosphate 3-phosphatidyltransferase